MEKEKEIDIFGPKLLYWIRKDAFIIIVCLFTILAVFYMLFVYSSYKEACNEFWINQIESNQCYDLCMVTRYNFSMPVNIMGQYDS